MRLSDNTALVTGGGSGIGLALAARFLAAGSTVIICGRDMDRLKAAKDRYPALHVIRADLASAEEREALVESVLAGFPALDVLVNNAGIQRRGSFLSDRDPWAQRRIEIGTNLEAPIHLVSLLLPHLQARERGAIVNVTSGLAFVPVTFAPVYAATKAALHSFTMALRAELAGTAIDVVEIVPPAVDTDLGGAGLHDQGVPVDIFADAVMARITAGEIEIGHGSSDHFRTASREELDAVFRQLNG